MGQYSNYDGAHNHPVNRALHLIAIPIGFSSLIVIWFHWIIALLLIPAAFALAWLGHLIEGNQPAFLTNPAHVLIAPPWMVRRLFGKPKPAPSAAPVQNIENYSLASQKQQEAVELQKKHIADFQQKYVGRQRLVIITVVAITIVAFLIVALTPSLIRVNR